MAKDGTNRGGRRVRAGGKPDALADKITKGRAAKVLEVADLSPASRRNSRGNGKTLRQQYITPSGVFFLCIKEVQHEHTNAPNNKANPG